MGQKSLFKNSIYKALLSFANIVVPIIIGPYITRLLDVELYGTYNKVYAEFQVFLIFATFGIYTFGVRGISKIRDDREKVSELFTNLFLLGIITNIVTGIVYIIYALISSSGITQSIYFVFIIQIVANIFYIEFLNEALENYKFITIKTLIVKVLYLVLLLTMVKKPSDIIIYSIIISGIVFLNNIISYIYVKKRIKFNFKQIHLLKYIKPLFLVLIITNIEILYSQLDRIMLGKFVNDVSVTLYYIPYYLISTLASIPYAIINVSIPRLSYIVESKDKESYEGALNTSVTSLLFIIVPMCMGVAVLAPEVIFLYAGDKYINTGMSAILILACIYRIIISIESIMTNLVLYANNKEKILVRFSLIFGLFNLAMNSLLVLMHKLTPFNAMLSTGIAEILLCTVQYAYIRRTMNIKLKLFSKQNMTYLILALCFIPIAMIVKHINLGFYINIIIIMGICILFYVGMLFIKKDSTINMLFHKFLGKFLRKKGVINE